MKVLYAPFRFMPRPIGGGNIHAQSQAAVLRERGVTVVEWTPRPYASASPSAAVKDFAGILEEERPDIVHFFTFRPDLSVPLLREAKRRGIPTVFSYISAETGCGRKTLLRWGEEPCSSIFDLNLCASCTLHGYGLPRIVSGLVGRTPVRIGSSLRRMKILGKAGTALRMRAQIQASQQMFRNFLDEVDRIVAMCEWTRALLLRNKIPEEKVAVSRFRVHHELPARSVQKKEASFPLRIAWVGRAHAQKGPQILIPALRREPGLHIVLDLFGPISWGANSPWFRHLRKLAGNDRRISFHPMPMPIDRLAVLLQRYDALAVPSQWLETGPLVVLESFAAGTPVIGSNWGGISELVRNGVDGLLVDSPHRLESWQAVLRRICAEPNLLKGLRENVLPPRTMNEAAEEMEALYHGLLVN